MFSQWHLSHLSDWKGESCIERLCTDDSPFALPVASDKLINSPRNHCRCPTTGVGSNLHGTEVLLCGRTAFINYSFTSIMTDPYQSPMVLLPTDFPLTAAADTLSRSATMMACLCLFGISPSSCPHYKWEICQNASTSCSLLRICVP